MRKRYIPGTNFILNNEKYYPNIELVAENKCSSGSTKFIEMIERKFINKDTGEELPPYVQVTRTTKPEHDGLPDAVSALPYYIDENCEPIFIVGFQYRFALRNPGVECSLLAGLIDKADTEEYLKSGNPEKTILKAVSRELSEECGEVKVKKAIALNTIMNKSAGLTSETEQPFLVEIEGIPGAQNLEKSEFISCVEIKGRDLEAFCEELESLNSSKTKPSIIIFNAIDRVLGKEKYKKFIKESIKAKKLSINNDLDNSETLQ